MHGASLCIMLLCFLRVSGNLVFALRKVYNICVLFCRVLSYFFLIFCLSIETTNAKVYIHIIRLLGYPHRLTIVRRGNNVLALDEWCPVTRGDALRCVELRLHVARCVLPYDKYTTVCNHLF